MLGYLGADGFTSTFQDSLFRGYQMSAFNQMLYVNAFSSLISAAGDCPLHLRHPFHCCGKCPTRAFHRMVCITVCLVAHQPPVPAHRTCGCFSLIMWY